MKHLLFIFLLLLFASCHSSRQAILTEPVVLNNKDSIKETTVVKTIYVPVTVEVPIPQQSESIVTAADTSRVETDIAVSEAWINEDGTLYHSIENKPVTYTAETYVPQTTTDHNIEAIKTKEIPVPQPYAVEVERKLTLMEQIKLSSWWLLLIISLFSISYIFRNPLYKLVRKII